LVRIRVSRGAGGKGDRRWEEEENKEILYMDLEGLKPLALSGDVIKKMNAKGKRNCPEEEEKGWGREQRLDGD
jgi:hypothetical protein